MYCHHCHEKIKPEAKYVFYKGRILCFECGTGSKALSLAAKLVSQERNRQIVGEGYSLDSDLVRYEGNKELLEAANYFLTFVLEDGVEPNSEASFSDNDVANLIKCAALICAHIDVLLHDPRVHK